MITGHATIEGTKRYADKHAELRYNALNGTGLTVAEAGFGCYRVTVDDLVHRQALEKALREGINLIDTSANYWDGDSELLVGEVLAELTGAGELARDEVVVVSKAGYLQGLNYSLSQQRKQEGRPFPDLVEYGKGLEHCIHPEFLEDQLTRSLERMQLETLDVYLLHNPEYYLSWAKKAGVPVEAAREEYYRRIELAFRHLEEEVARGRIRRYGISSNTFPAAAESPEFTSLERVWAIAESVSADHHFRVIQFPMNLLETGAATERNQRDGAGTVLEFVREKRLGVLINRPLNAFGGGSLIRLAEAIKPDDAPVEEIPSRIEELLGLEASLQRTLLPQMGLEEAEQSEIAEKLVIGKLLNEHWRQFNSAEHWMDAVSRILVPMLQTGMRALAGRADESGEIEPWVKSYMDKVNALFPLVTTHYQRLDYEEKQAFKQRLADLDPEWKAAGSLSRIALRALRSTEGITTVLVGMRQARYVEDVLAELRQDVPVTDRRASWHKAKTR